MIAGPFSFYPAPLYYLCPMKRISFRPLIIFYILVTYILIQFCWWAYHIISLENTIYHLQLGQGKVTDITGRILMVAGEGMVFLLLMITGVFITRKSFKKESDLAGQQKNFMLSVTHELKSPIASIRLFLETLSKRQLEREMQLKILSDTIRETDRLTALVDNILYSSKIESGSFELVKEPINLSELTRQISSLVQQVHNSHQFHFNIEKDIFFISDKTAWSSILLNLVENAIKYSPRGTNIEVTLKRKGPGIRLQIADEGGGVPNVEKDKIFSKFYRVGNEETRKTKGTGLGLYIVKGLVIQLGGTIEVRDRAPVGTTFEIIIPN